MGNWESYIGILGNSERIIGNQHENLRIKFSFLVSPIGSISTVTTWVTISFITPEEKLPLHLVQGVYGVSTEGVQHSWFIEEGVSGWVVLREVVRGICSCHQTTEWGEGLFPSEEVRVLNPVQKS